jgi:hypothetical protein
MSDEGRMDPADFFDAVFGLGSCECGHCEESTNRSDTERKVSKHFAADMWDVLDHAGNVLLNKQEDYGPLNISRAPGGPLNGLRVRMFDKISRINNLIDTGAEPNNESLYDSFLDLANYSIIAMMVLDGTWPELEEEQ